MTSLFIWAGHYTEVGFITLHCIHRCYSSWVEFFFRIHWRHTSYTVNCKLIFLLQNFFCSYSSGNSEFKKQKLQSGRRGESQAVISTRFKFQMPPPPLWRHAGEGSAHRAWEKRSSHGRTFNLASRRLRCGLSHVTPHAPALFKVLFYKMPQTQIASFVRAGNFHR